MILEAAKELRVCCSNQRSKADVAGSKEAEGGANSETP